MQSPWFVLSPCGTSLLTNASIEDERRVVNRNTNAKKKEDVGDDAQVLEGLIQRVKSRLNEATRAEAARMSAELNGIIKLYGESKDDGKRHYHQLLSTDTWLGEVTANLVAEWLLKEGFKVDVKRQPDLRTEKLAEFQLALSDLVRWAEETLPGFRQSGYRVIFNLTGGFKSVQGFLQTLATFYADEAIYIFETGSLLRIPRLPVTLNAEPVVKDHLSAFRRMSSSLSIGPDETKDIPETLLLKVDGEVALSPWGGIVWEQTKRTLYEEQVWPSPSDRLKYSESFNKSLAKLAADRIRHVNERVDQLARCLERNGDYNPPSLDLKPLRGNPAPPSTHEADAWADQDAKRLFGHYEGKVFVLDKLDRALH